MSRDLRNTAKHLAGRAFTSDWFVNSFTMVAYEKSFCSSSVMNFLSKPRLKEIFSKAITKLSADQSEVNVLPARCQGMDKMSNKGVISSEFKFPLTQQ